MGQPKVSVIIPVYNAEKYLRQCLDSIVNQTMQEIEVICVDDGSKDDSADILNEYRIKDERVRVLQQENSGAWKARNVGIAAARGEYLIFLDSDDFAELNLCSEVWHRAKETESDVVLFDADFYYPDKNLFAAIPWMLSRELLPKKAVFNRTDLPDKLFSVVAGGPCNKMYRREFILRHEIDFPSMRSLEDVPFVYAALAFANRISVVPSVLEHYRRETNNKNLVSQIDKYPHRIFDSFGILKQRLQNMGVYQEIRQAFINRAASDFIDQYLYTIHNEDAIEFYKLYLAYVASYDFELRDHNKNYFAKPMVYNHLQKLFVDYPKAKTVTIPKISIIIPVYNSELYLRQCLNSLLKQTFQEFEIICVDDGSTDDSLRIIKDYEKIDARIKVLTQRNLFAGVARNTGLAAASGDYVLFLDSDDFFQPSMLEELYDTALKYNAEIVLCDGYYFNNETAESTPARFLLQRGNLPAKNPFSYLDTPNKILHVTIDCPWNKLFKKSFIKRHDLKFQELRSANDVYFVDTALLLADKIAVVDKKLVNYRTNVKTSLQANRQKEPLNFYQALSAVKKRMEGESRYQEIRGSLISLFVAGCRSHLNNAKNIEEYTLLYSFYVETAFAEWEIDPDDRGQFVFEDDRRWVISVLGSTAKEYLERGQENGTIRFIKNQPKIASELLRSLPATVKCALGGVPKVIVSMTSFPARIHVVEKVINNILEQSIKVDKIFLYLAESQFPKLEADLPRKLLDCVSLGLEIKWCKEDIRPHKKYFYVMQEFPNDVVITIDDDLIYRTDMVELLLRSYIKYPHAVSAMRTHLIVSTQDGEIAPYKQWLKEYSGILNTPSMQLFSTSGAGTLYPPSCMHAKVFDMDVIQAECLNADDIWLKVMQVLANVPVVLAYPNEPLKYIRGTQEDRLYNANVLGGENDTQLRNTIQWCEKLIKADEPSIRTRIFSEKATGTGLIANKTDVPNNKTYDGLNRTIVALKHEIANIHMSWSYRIGRFITYIPRKIRGGIRCYQEHGMSYTLRRIREKIATRFGK